MPDMYTGACFLDNVYGLSTSTDDLELMQSTYQKSVNELTDVEWHEKFIAEAIGMDIMLSGKESILYPFWVLRRSIAITHQLEMYQKLGVTLTLQDYCPESFYAGIPKPTASDIKRAKEYLNERSDN